MTHIDLCIHVKLGGVMIKKAFTALLLAGIVLCVGLIALKTHQFWNGGLQNAAPYIQFKMTKQ